MAQEIVQLQASVVDMKTLKDKSWKLTFNTQELSGKEVALLADTFQGEGWLVWKVNDEVEQEDIPKGMAESGIEPKTPSKRLRSVLFLLWQQSGEPYDDFNRWYAGQMEKIIDLIKNKLEDE